ncbi:hypothetical protein GCM10009665_09920 [Kitasatospora nipponensis]|uniref:LPXTG-motif cell wall-anchored protein n=1 Tax=Kitasatospora nipponensis TaxID=258049 RepID=A0ABP4GHV6_9ACTN
MTSAATRRAVGAGTTALVALLWAATGTLPAQAADQQLKLFLPATMQLPMTAPADPMNDAYSAPNPRVGRTGSTPLHQVQVSFDATALAGIADFHVQFGSGFTCATKGSVVTCDEGDLNYDSINVLQHYWLTSVAGVKPGTTGLLHVTASSPDAPSTSSDVRVSVGGPDLKIKELDQAQHVKPGGTVSPVIEFANLGQVATSKVVVELTVEDGLTADRRASNCEYAQTKPTGGAKQWPGDTEVICALDVAVAPGEVYRLDPIELGVSASAWATEVGLAVYSGEDAPFSQAPGWRAADTFQRGTGAALGGTRTEDAALLGSPRHVYDNSFEYGVLTDNTADLVTLGSWAPQGDGKQGVLSVGLRNDGPASIEYAHSGNDVADVRVTLPHGVTATKVPAECHQQEMTDHSLAYRCETSDIVLTGYRAGFDLTLQVDDPAAAPQVKVDLQDESNWNDPKAASFAFDPNPANNTVQVALGAARATASATPTGAAAAPVAATSAAGTPRASATPSDPTENHDTTAAPGTELAFTGGGAGAGTIAALGTGVLALGIGALAFATRRRRATAQR